MTACSQHDYRPQTVKKHEVIIISPDGAKKGRPKTVIKTHANNASLFDESDDEADLDEPLSKRLRTTNTHKVSAQPCLLVVTDFLHAANVPRLSTTYRLQTMSICRLQNLKQHASHIACMLRPQ